jgi:hypothetical protein
MMDQGVSYEGLKNRKAIKAVMDRQQAMDQGIRYGSRMNQGESDVSGAIDQEASDRSRSNRSSHNNVLLIIMSKNDSILK